MSTRFFASFMCAALAGAALVASAGGVLADPPTPAPQSSESGVLIIIRAGGFFPSNLTVAPGTPITFRNDDHVSPNHTVASTTGAFGPASLGYGMTLRVTLTKPGKYPFNAADSPYMKGEITVSGASSGSESPSPSSPAPSTPAPSSSPY
jgi:plastocyanin